jgi:hypothetical protein
MRKVESEGILPGPKAVLFSGFSENERETVMGFFGEESKDTAFVSLTKPMIEMRLQDVLESNDTENEILDSKAVPRVLIFSGISMEMLHKLIDSIRNSEIPRPIMATSTEHNLSFTVKELLIHLLEEQRQFRK